MMKGMTCHYLNLNRFQKISLKKENLLEPLWDGMTYDSTGMYTNVYTDVNGCDSTVTLDLTINASDSRKKALIAPDLEYSYFL